MGRWGRGGAGPSCAESTASRNDLDLLLSDDGGGDGRGREDGGPADGAEDGTGSAGGVDSPIAATADRGAHTAGAGGAAAGDAATAGADRIGKGGQDGCG